MSEDREYKYGTVALAVVKLQPSLITFHDPASMSLVQFDLLSNCVIMHTALARIQVPPGLA